MNAKPKTLVYAEALAGVEQRIVDAMPEIVDGLIARAREGDLKAAVYLCDRIMGKAAVSAVAPSEDRRPPYTEDLFRLDHAERESDQELRRLMARIGAGGGA